MRSSCLGRRMPSTFFWVFAASSACPYAFPASLSDVLPARDSTYRPSSHAWLLRVSRGQLLELFFLIGVQFDLFLDFLILQEHHHSATRPPPPIMPGPPTPPRPGLHAAASPLALRPWSPAKPLISHLDAAPISQVVGYALAYGVAATKTDFTAIAQKRQKSRLNPKTMRKNVDAICYHIGTYGYG